MSRPTPQTSSRTGFVSSSFVRRRYSPVPRSVYRRAGEPATWWLSFFAYDFLYWLWHMLSHRVSCLWLDHVVHHSSEDYNLTTALRQPFLGFATPGFLVSTAPLALLGFPYKHPRPRRRSSSDDASTRNIRVVAAASPRPLPSSDDPS